MLPDFPILKGEIQKLILTVLRRKIDSGDPVISRIKRFTQHEGSELRFDRRGYEPAQEGPQQVGTEFQVRLDEVPLLLGERLEAKLDEIAAAMIPQIAKQFFNKVGETCNLAGNTLNAGGKPLNAELLLDMMSKVETDFSSDGKPKAIFVIHPDNAPLLKKLSEELENDPELKRRSTEIMDRQREEWAARESNRKLVD